MGAIKTMKEVESALPQKKEINYVRALDKEGNPILINKEDLAQVVGELMPVVTPEKDGLSNSKFATTKIKSEGKRSILLYRSSSSQWAPFAIRVSCISTGEPSSDFCVYIAGNTMELQDSTKVYVKYLYGQPNSDTYLKMKYETDHRISIYLTSDNSLGDRTIVRELIVRDSMYDMATQDDEITGLADCTIVQ